MRLLNLFPFVQEVAVVLVKIQAREFLHPKCIWHKHSPVRHLLLNRLASDNKAIWRKSYSAWGMMMPNIPALGCAARGFGHAGTQDHRRPQKPLHHVVRLGGCPSLYNQTGWKRDAGCNSAWWRGRPRRQPSPGTESARWRGGEAARAPAAPCVGVAAQGGFSRPG